MVPLAARLLRSMSRDKELFHLTTFVTFADHASSDGNSRRILRQLRSAVFQAFNRRTSQHVNTLELASLLNYLRLLPARGEIISCHLFHMFDSLVEASLTAKDCRPHRNSPQQCAEIPRLSNRCVLEAFLWLWFVDGAA